MEHTDRLIKIIMIILIIFALFMQIKVTLMIYNNLDKLDADPLVYGAQKFNINECSCFIDDKEIWFNQSISITKTKISQPGGLKQVNFSQFDENLLGI